MDCIEQKFSNAKFSGSDYDEKLDKRRLTGQILDIFTLMKDKKWRSLREISNLTGHGESSISAQLRNLRKATFGSHTVDRRRTGNPTHGKFEYRLIENED